MCKWNVLLLKCILVNCAALMNEFITGIDCNSFTLTCNKTTKCLQINSFTRCNIRNTKHDVKRYTFYLMNGKH